MAERHYQHQYRRQFNSNRRRHHFTNPSKAMHNKYYSSTNNNTDKPSSSHASHFYNDDQQNALIGTCPFMCPVEERVQRERLRDLDVFERLYGDPSKSSPGLAVKKFCRTITTKHVQASDVRPLSVLEDTLSYLLNLLHSTEYPFEVVHDFLFDRTRSIRQDLSMQNLSNVQVISMYEKMLSRLERLQYVGQNVMGGALSDTFTMQLKFHVISEHKFRQCSGSPNISSKSYLNMEQLTKTLITLYSLYEVNQSSESVYQNEAEYRSLYVLLHLQPDSQRESLPLWFRSVPSPIMKSKEMRFAINVLRYFRLGNYRRFIYTVEAEASYLQFCILEPYINQVRALAISCVNYSGYKLQPYPLLDLSKLLMMKVSDLESLCQDCGLETSTDEVGSALLPTKQTSFVNPKRDSQIYYPLDSERLERILVDMAELQ